MPAMYLQNKYTKWYNLIIENAQNRVLEGYTEKHHIIPKSLDGSNDKSNLVKLTAREHFVCHWLLTKMTEDKTRSKMYLALLTMNRISNTQSRNKITSRLYAKIRQEISKQNSGAGNPMYGKTHSAETRQRIRDKVLAANKRNGKRTLTNEHKKKISLSKIGKPRPEWLKAQMSKQRKGKPGRDNNSGKHWYNNGTQTYLAFHCPPGCITGRLQTFGS